MPSTLNITTISGFLGAGKTTLVNHLLREGYPGKRLAVLVNDFGKLAIDANLIRSEDDNLLELRNGCICCSLQYHLATGLTKLRKLNRFDRVILETSGISDAGQLLKFLHSLEGEIRANVDQVIAVADASRFLPLSRKMPIIRSQLTGAQLILLNRCDLADEDLRKETRAELQNLAPQAVIVETEHSRFDTARLNDLPTIERSGPDQGAAPSTKHTRSWKTTRVTFPGIVSLPDLEAALSTLPDSVHRIKGFVDDGEHLWSVDRVGSAVETTRVEQQIPSKLVGQLVIIAETPLAPLLSRTFSSWPGVKVSADP